MWDSVIEILEIVHQDERNPSGAGGFMEKMECFSFVFNMKMMLQILRITNELSLLLQKGRIKILFKLCLWLLM
jgi:hypothetical protein